MSKAKVKRPWLKPLQSNRYDHRKLKEQIDVISSQLVRAKRFEFRLPVVHGTVGHSPEEDRSHRQWLYQMMSRLEDVAVPHVPLMWQTASGPGLADAR